MMKTILRGLTFLTLMLVALSASFAQTKEDVIYLLDGNQKKGKVVSIGDDIIKFSYTGEEVQYELKRQTVDKIVFSNGREESFRQPSTESANTSSGVMTNTANTGSNQLAVIPFEIVSNDQSLTTDAMRREIQQSCVDALKSRSLSFQIQDPRSTNATLTKAGIALSDVANHTPDELAKLLQVDYVVLGMYDIENRGTMSFGSGNTTYSDKTKDNKTKGTATQSNSTYTSTSYDTKVQLSIYDSMGRQLFSDTRKPFLGGLDSYKGALKTLAKRISIK
jgi:hypothetical protein